MTTALAKQETGIKAYAPEERYFTEEQMKLLSDHIMKGASPIELQYFGEVCKRVGLDPFKKQIHAVQRWDSNAKRMVWSYQTGIDGYVAIAHRSGLCAGIEDIKFIPEDESAPNPTKATCTVWKIVGGQRVPFTASARWSEYVQLVKDKDTGQSRPNSMWAKMPYGQLGKCAKSLALRMAFPEEIGGILTDVEMEQADSEVDRGQQVKGRAAAQFDLESRPFEEPTKPAKFTGYTGTTYTEGQVGPDPKPPEVPAEAKPQAKPDAKVVEAEVVPETPSLAVPEPIGKWTRGKWKESIGALRGKALAEARQSAFENGNADACAQACASIYDEVQARLATKNTTEPDFAALVCEQGLESIEFPADLWSKPSHYPAILELAKQLP